MKSATTGTIMVLALSLTACEEVDDVVAPDPPDTELAGVYTIDSWTLNEEGCEEPGPDNGSDLLLWPRVGVNPDSGTATDSAWVFGYLCSDVDNCAERQNAGEFEASLVNGWHFDEGSDADGWVASRDFAFIDHDSEEEDACAGYRVDALLTPAEGGVRIETRTEIVRWAGDVTCADETVAEHVSGQCSELQIIDATFEVDLPPPPQDG